jgi:hypothetical protein
VLLGAVQAVQNADRVVAQVGKHGVGRGVESEAACGKKWKIIRGPLICCARTRSLGAKTKGGRGDFELEGARTHPKKTPPKNCRGRSAGLKPVLGELHSP